MRKLAIHLSEHGGTGLGVIGVLAGSGLRLSGNDGRFKGKLQIETVDGTAPVQAILAQARIDEVRTTEGAVLGPEDKVVLEGKVKSVLLDCKAVLLVAPYDGGARGQWKNIQIEQYKRY